MDRRSVFFITGVSGTGKSTLGKRVACDLEIAFEEGDSFHSKANIAKMSAGIPLEDVDRWEWLKILNSVAQNHLVGGRHVIIACSALKATYREVLAQDIESNTKFIYLHGSQDLINRRIKEREHFFTGANMLESQFVALDPPSHKEAKHIDVTQEFDSVLLMCKEYIEAAIGIPKR